MRFLVTLALLSFGTTLLVVSQSFGKPTCNGSLPKSEFTNCTAESQTCDGMSCQAINTCNDTNLLFTIITADKRKHRTDTMSKSRACVSTTPGYCIIKSADCYQMQSCYLDTTVTPSVCTWGMVCVPVVQADYAEGTSDCTTNGS